MPDELVAGSWARPNIAGFRGQYVGVSRLDPDADIDDLYEVSHRTEDFKRLWTYMGYGPFPDQDTMYAWLTSIKDSQDPIFYSVYSYALRRKAGMISILNIVPDVGRAELGHIWYSPLAQKSRVNTEVTFLFLQYLFDALRYRRVEWKCDNQNEASKRAALRMGFQYEGLFRKHMIVKGRNRDTAWFSILDEEWPALKSNFERYLATPGLSLTEMNRDMTTKR